jgi:hypothetical protein
MASRTPARVLAFRGCEGLPVPPRQRRRSAPALRLPSEHVAQMERLRLNNHGAYEMIMQLVDDALARDQPGTRGAS